MLLATRNSSAMSAATLPCADDGPANRRGLAAVVGRPGGPRCQQRHQSVHVAGGRRGQELLGDLCRPLGVDGTEPVASGVHVLAGAVRHLSHSCRGFADRFGDFVVVEAERLAQHEHRPLVGGERFEKNQHRHRNRFGENDIGGGIAVVEQQWLRKPRPDVVLATAHTLPQSIERLAGHQLRQIRLGVPHRREVHVRPPQIAVLQHIVGFGCRAEDFVGDREQQRPQMGEPLGMVLPAVVTFP